jgi:hypothetical protein
MERPSKNLTPPHLKSLKRHLMVVKIPKSPKQLLEERFLRVKQGIQKKIVLTRQHERNLNTGILKFLVAGLPRGRMNSMYNEAKNTGMI